jgi:IS5 family transposase
VLLASAKQEKLESGKVVRVDSTVTAALIHEPSDSSLLWDAVRVMVRLLQQAEALGSAHPMARPSPRGKEAGSGDRIYPRSPQTGEALSRTAQDHAHDLELSAAGE